RTASGTQFAAAANAQNLAGTKHPAGQDLLAAATRPAALSAAQAADAPGITDLSGTASGAALLQHTSPIQTGAPVAPAVTTPLSSPNWAADFSQQLVHLAQGRHGAQAHTAELRLDPPGLGPVRITLQVGDSITHVSFVSPHAVVRQAIENALPQLQQQLGQAGLSLGQANVSDQSSGQQGFEHAANSGSGNGRGFSVDGVGGVAAHDGQHSALPRTAARLPDALVDTFV
ncbi:MAG: flagellar hook-length control protein FliK, partial [Alcaligenaceae bacterium]|nr:flagellar hook-length control protein FliK [Alcaligenaceae bacterium]